MEYTLMHKESETTSLSSINFYILSKPALQTPITSETLSSSQYNGFHEHVLYFCRKSPLDLYMSPGFLSHLNPLCINSNQTGSKNIKSFSRTG